MDKALITGGTGFVGYWMHQTEPAHIGGCYLSRRDYQQGWWMDEDWDYIVHLAPTLPGRVLRTARKQNTRVLYCSSGIVYHPENNSDYRQNKVRWEQECLDSGVDVVIARLFAFYGERLDSGKALTQFIQAARKGEPLRIWGDGSTVRSYMHGRTLGRLIWSVLFRGVSGEAYDIGDDKPVTMLQLAQMVTAVWPAPIIIEGGRDAMPYYVPPDTAKTLKLLDTP